MFRETRSLLSRAFHIHSPLAFLGVAFFALGAVTTLGIFVDPTPVTGQPAWIKPTKFAISLAVYAFTALWLLDKLPVPSKPRQYEFARLNLTYTLLSKRVLTQLVRDGHVSGWDDPRMPTIAGLKRRGVPPAAVLDWWSARLPRWR